MAEEHAQSAGHPAMDYEEHEKTYRLFLKLIKYSMGSVALLLIFMAFFLT
ncbi:MAG TPA: aa3-type cytochrome c oxidase subunit IV [Methylocella sp.]|nr:aa3-type cytochrome c oxidase subunit IV [Methylocella sp.]